MTAERCAAGREGSTSPESAFQRADSGWFTPGGSLDPQTIVSIAARDISHSDDDVHCGLTVVSTGRAPETVAATDDLPVRVDWLQQEMRQGPGMGSPVGEMVVSKDLAADDRWLEFGKLCVAVMNVRCMVSIEIPLADAHRALLSWYSSEPMALDHLDVDAALRLSRMAVPALDALVEEFNDTLFESAAGTCGRVAVAVGMAVARYRIDPSEAFALILETSSRLHRPLLDVACEVASDGWLPETTGSWSHRPGSGSQGVARGPDPEAPPPGVPRRQGAPGTGRGDPAASPRLDRTLSIGGPELWHAASPTELRLPARPRRRPGADPPKARRA